MRFILWGGLHGAALALHKLWMRLVPGAKATGREMHWWVRIPGILLTFHIVCLGWLMFRADTMQTVELMLRQIFDHFDARIIPQVIEGYTGVFLLIALGYLLHMLPASADRLARQTVARAPLALQVVLAAAVHLVRDAGQIERHSTFHLLPILTRRCTTSTTAHFWPSISTGGSCMDRLMLTVSGTAMGGSRSTP